MAKANKATKQATEINTGFDIIIKALDQIAKGSKKEMPLLTSALKHSIEVVKLYRKGFNYVAKN